MSSKSSMFVRHFVNKNPRNLERLRLQPKPNGWGMEKHQEQKNYIYRVDFHAGKNSTSAAIVHYKDGVVVEASTSEKSVKSQLFSLTDGSAAYNIGRILAHKCRMGGIKYCTSGIPAEELANSKRKMMFVKALQESGIVLEEQECIPHTHLNDPTLVWDQFEYKHTREDKLDELDLSLEPGKGLC